MRTAARGVVVGLVVTSMAACSESHVGTSEPATLVVHEGAPCNVDLVEEQDHRHGLDWYTKATLWPSEADARALGADPASISTASVGEHEGTLTYESEDSALFEADGIRVRFKGKEPDVFVTADCPGHMELWNPPPEG